MDHQNIMVVKKYGSMVNTLVGNSSNFGQMLDSNVGSSLEGKDSMMPDDLTITQPTGQMDENISETPQSMQETTAYQG